MNYKELADILFPNITKTIEDYEKIYLKRNTKGEITRFAPSPTGFLHMGGLFSSFISERFAHQANGTFILRIEDTDEKRKVENGVELLIKDLEAFDFKIDEGPNNIGGNYGPYIQSERKEIYQTFAKYLVSIGKAYPCFCTEEHLNELREMQTVKKLRVGYYGKYAICRNLSIEKIKENINNNIQFVIRLKSNGDFENKIKFHDLIKGNMDLPENDMDHVILKSDGMPPYAFAHVVDDYLMRITTVIRDDSYVSSITYHLELWNALGFDIPHYAHIAPLTKKEGTTTRKLSKRKDPEAAVSYYTELGIPNEAVKLYLATLMNSDFEMWYTQNADKNISDFEFKYNKMAVGGSIFDVEKLNSISKIYFSRLKAIDLYNELLKYTNIYDKDFNNIITKFKEYTISILNIEREQSRPRKDIGSYSDVKKELYYMYDEYSNDLYKDIEIKEFYSTKLLEDYINNYYNVKDDKETWFNKIKEIAPIYNFASDTKSYKENPEKYNGSISDICEIIRVCVTGKTQTPDLYEILKLLGNERIKFRINKFKDFIKK